MATLLECLERHGQAGIPVSDAKQLILWLYCSKSVLPSELQNHPPNRAELITVFSDLTAGGVIAADPMSGLYPDATAWRSLLDDLLSGRVALDHAFLERARTYLGA
jgi:hypothetical protein